MGEFSGVHRKKINKNTAVLQIQNPKVELRWGCIPPYAPPPPPPFPKRVCEHTAASDNLISSPSKERTTRQPNENLKSTTELGNPVSLQYASVQMDTVPGAHPTTHPAVQNPSILFRSLVCQIWRRLLRGSPG